MRLFLPFNLCKHTCTHSHVHQLVHGQSSLIPQVLSRISNLHTCLQRHSQQENFARCSPKSRVMVLYATVPLPISHRHCWGHCSFSICISEPPACNGGPAGGTEAGKSLVLQQIWPSNACGCNCKITFPAFQCLHTQCACTATLAFYSKVGSRRTLFRRTLRLENAPDLRTRQAGISG